MSYYSSTTPVIPRARTPLSAAPPQQGQIQPGSITYTTSTGPDGQIIYNCFKAVSASYQTPQGVVTGIQWIPAEATSILPAGATPADDQFRASFQRPMDDRWDREEADRMRRREDKERRRLEKEERRLEKEERRLEKEREEEREIRRAREREERERRRGSGYGYDALDRQFGDMGLKDKAYGSGVGAPYTYSADGPYAPAAQAGYGTAGRYAPPGRPVSPYDAGAAPIAPRPVSPYAMPGGIQRAPSPYAPPAGNLARAPSPYNPQMAGLARAPSPYNPAAGIARAPSPYAPPTASGIARAASPYGQPPPGAGIARAASPYQPPSVYPPGHVMEGRPIPTGAVRPLSRAGSPVPGYAAPGAAAGGYGYTTPGAYPTSSPSVGYGAVAQQGAGYAVAPYPPGIASPSVPTTGSMLASPEGFQRPPSMAVSYARFETFKVQDMDDFYENIPKMPYVLQPHDVYHEDWIRLMTDLSLSWAGKLPVPEYSADGRPPKRTVLTSDLIDLWNTSFFIKRGVELVLFKGRERRSGRLIGQVELHLPGFDDIAEASESSSSESSSESDGDFEDRRYNAYGGAYGRQTAAQMAELAEARRLRRERKKAEKKRRRLEKKQRKKQKEAERTYALYVTCVPREI